MQYKVRTFTIPNKINKVAEEVDFEIAGLASDAITITISDVDGDSKQFKFDNTRDTVGADGDVILLPSLDAPSQAVRTQRLFDEFNNIQGASGLNLQFLKETDTKIKIKQLKGGDVVSIALSAGAGGTITEITAGTEGVANPAYGDPLVLTPSNLGFNPAAGNLSKVQVSCLDFGGTFGLNFRPVGTGDYITFTDPVNGVAADAGDDLILLGRDEDPIFDAIEITFANPDDSDITVYCTFIER